MFHVNVVLDKSKVHGIGLFARENIKKGWLVYTDNPNLNLLLSPESFSSLHIKEQNYIKHYGYFNQERKEWYLAFDNIRFLNHASDANVTLTDKGLCALKNIAYGQELLQDYRELHTFEERQLID